jgi:hypothetical protein
VPMPHQREVLPTIVHVVAFAVRSKYLKLMVSRARVRKARLSSCHHAWCNQLGASDESSEEWSPEMTCEETGGKDIQTKPSQAETAKATNFRQSTRFAMREPEQSCARSEHSVDNAYRRQAGFPDSPSQTPNACTRLRETENQLVLGHPT